MQLEMGAASHVGAVRQVNEDACFAATHLALVADGMGGHARGDVASRLAIDPFRALGSRTDLVPADIQRALAEANAGILADARANAERAGMGTTLAGIALVDYFGSPHWLVFNVGDSRVYRLGTDGLSLLTHDHSEVQELVDVGRLTAEQARVHPLRNIVTRSLGTDPAPEVDVWLFPLAAEDVFVLCSDGLTNELDEATIAALGSASTHTGDAAARLVGAAVEAGGRDNVTVVVVRVPREATIEDSSQVTTGPRTAFLSEGNR